MVTGAGVPGTDVKLDEAGRRAYLKLVLQVHVPSLFLTGGADFLTLRSVAKLEWDMGAGASDDDAPWETARYAEIFHGFRNWHSAAGYDAKADARSWASASRPSSTWRTATGKSCSRRTGGLCRRNGR